MEATKTQGTIRRMTCCCCGSDAGRFAQWWNRDTGFGVCRPCALQHPNDFNEESVGKEGVHWANAEQWAAIEKAGGPYTASAFTVEALADILKRAAQAAADADPGEGFEHDGGTCNMDTPAFRIDGVRGAMIQKAAAIAGVDVTEFKWGGGRRWFWLFGVTQGQANRRTTMMKAAQKVLSEGENIITGFHACGYYQCD